MAEVSSTKQRAIPAGKFFFDPIVGGAYTGEIALGLCPGGSITIKSTSIQSYSAQSGVKELDDETIISIDRTGKVTCRQISLKNIGLFVIGDVSTHTQAATTGTVETLTVKKDRYYQLGRTVANPSGCQGVASVVVKSGDEVTTYDLTDDYTVDLALARLYIVPGGAITDGSQIKVTYNQEAKTWDRIAAAALADVVGALRFIASPMKGDVRDFYAPKCTLNPNGDLVLAQDDPKYAELAWDLSFAKGLNDEPALLINGRPA